MGGHRARPRRYSEAHLRKARERDGKLWSIQKLKLHEVGGEGCPGAGGDNWRGKSLHSAIYPRSRSGTRKRGLEKGTGKPHEANSLVKSPWLGDCRPKKEINLKSKISGRGEEKQFTP